MIHPSIVRNAEFCYNYFLVCGYERDACTSWGFGLPTKKFNRKVRKGLRKGRKEKRNKELFFDLVTWDF